MCTNDALENEEGAVIGLRQDVTLCQLLPGLPRDHLNLLSASDFVRFKISMWHGGRGRDRLSGDVAEEKLLFFQVFIFWSDRGHKVGH